MCVQGLIQCSLYESFHPHSSRVGTLKSFLSCLLLVSVFEASNNLTAVYSSHDCPNQSGSGWLIVAHHGTSCTLYGVSGTS